MPSDQVGVQRRVPYRVVCAVDVVGGCGVSCGWFGLWGAAKKKKKVEPGKPPAAALKTSSLPAHETTHKQLKEGEKADTIHTKRQGKSQCHHGMCGKRKKDTETAMARWR